MNFNNRENKKYQTTCGQTIWGSRSVAVCALVVRTKPSDRGGIQVLTVKRGSKVSHPGLNCFPCGFLDFDETVPQAAVREIYEETGLEVDWRDLEFTELDSGVEKFQQNVTVHFVLYYTGEGQISSSNSSEGEIEEVSWIDYEDAIKLDWAFDHKKRVEELIKNI